MYLFNVVTMAAPDTAWVAPECRIRFNIQTYGRMLDVHVKIFVPLTSKCTVLCGDIASDVSSR